eukprot:4413303-Prymnesium_polylepis.1
MWSNMRRQHKTTAYYHSCAHRMREGCLVGAKPARSRGEAGAKPARSRREACAKPARSLREAGEAMTKGQEIPVRL